MSRADLSNETILDALYRERLNMVRIQISPSISPGTMWRIGSSPLVILVRHMSEFLSEAMGARCDYTRGTCPTWTDEECRCMVDPT